MESLDEKRARHAELLAKHGPNDGAVIELGAEIEAEGKPAPNLTFASRDESAGDDGSADA